MSFKQTVRTGISDTYRGACGFKKGYLFRSDVGLSVIVMVTSQVPRAF
jgi:hypothetical protein